MPESGTTQDLRARARAIRSAAQALDRAQVLDLHRRAGPDVWLGPTPTQCLDSMIRMRTAITGAATDLRAAAHDLEARAEQLAATHAGIPG